MASLASLSADQIISLTADHDVQESSHMIHLKKETNENEIEQDETSFGATMHHDHKDTILADDDPSTTPFCTSGSMNMHSYYVGGDMDGGGGGMIMYMDGFGVSLKGGQPCLNLYFENWTLDSRGKFLFAMAAIVALGILTEFISKARFYLQKKLSGKTRRIGITLLHGMQALVGYVLMLATMTFSVELFFSVIIGLGLGFAIFYDDNDTHVTTNPCCNFMQDEANERNETVITDTIKQERRAEEEEDDVSTDVEVDVRVAHVEAV